VTSSNLVLIEFQTEADGYLISTSVSVWDADRRLLQMVLILQAVRA
jgi:hypothetical protein